MRGNESKLSDEGETKFEVREGERERKKDERQERNKAEEVG